MSSPSFVNTNSFAVGVGPARRLLAQAPSGLLIVNNDAINSVWLSDQPSVVPGTGFLLGPLGSLTWARDSALYGVVDTGVTSPVSLTIGGAASAVDNPVAIGAAVAARLLATGIPNVLLEESIVNGVDVSVAPGNSITVDISKFASLVWLVNDLVTCQITQLDEIGNVVSDVSLTFDPTLNNDIMSMKASGTTLLITTAGFPFTNHGAQLWIMGTNRTQQHEFYRAQTRPRAMQVTRGTAAMAAGTTYPLTVQPASAYIHGSCYATFLITHPGGPITVVGELIVFCSNGSVNYNLLDTEQMALSGTGAKCYSWRLSLPLDWSSFKFFCRAADTGCTLQLDIIPEYV